MTLRTLLGALSLAVATAVPAADKTYTLEDIEPRPIGKGTQWEGDRHKGSAFSFQYRTSTGLPLTGTEVYSINCDGRMIPFFVRKHTSGSVEREHFVLNGQGRFEKIERQQALLDYVRSLGEDNTHPRLPEHYIPDCSNH